MRTEIVASLRDMPAGREADAILRACVHCGFCNATCPTYQLLGDELDGPRGRIYLIKQALEGGPVGPATQTHLDRCLTCLSCETTCPSGVRYGRLLDLGREWVAARVPRRPWASLQRWLLRRVLPYPARFARLLHAAQALRGLLPDALRRAVPPRRRAGPWPGGRHRRTMLVLDGCVQPALAPDINAAAARVLDRLGIALRRAPGAGCCGALSQHLTAPEEARAFMRRNIDAWWPAVEAGAEAIVMTASGCGAMVKDYAHHLRDDPAYADRARRISGLTRDLSQVLAGEDLGAFRARAARAVAVHTPCTLQHGQKGHGAIERILGAAGFSLTPVADAHLCCGSAGTYTLLQPALSRRLLENKIRALEAGRPEVIATANIGCLTHLECRAAVPVVHWIELLDMMAPPISDTGVRP